VGWFVLRERTLVGWKVVVGMMKRGDSVVVVAVGDGVQ